MKLLSITFLLLLAFIFESYAQTDTLIIKLSNNQVEKISITQIKKITFENVDAVIDNNIIYSNFSITGNYPNPANDQTNIEFEIFTFGNVEVTIYNNYGQKVQTLECNNCQVGKNSVYWNCHDMNNQQVQSGVYYYEINFNNERQTKKMIVIH